MTRRRGWALDAAFGALIALGQAPFGVIPAALIGLAGMIWRVSTPGSGRARAARTWRAGVAYFAVTLHWIVEPFLVDVPRHGWMAPFALVLMAGGLALFWGLAGWATARLQTRGAAMAGFALAFTLAEMLRSYIFTGFPWGLIGTIWIDTAPAQTVAYWGLHGLGLATFAALSAGLALGARLQTRGRAVATGAGLLGSLALIGLLAGAGALRPPAPAIPPEAPTLRLVQPNAAQHLKWDPEMIPLFFQRQLTLTAQPPEGAAPDLILWPETAIAYRLGGARPLLIQGAEAAGGVPLVLGAVRQTPAGPTNALAVIDPDGRPGAIYDKAHLVPFGEYIPFGDLAARLGIRGLAVTEGGGFHAGPGPVLLDLGALGQALPLICYEAIFPHFGRSQARVADWMLQITNDAWFGSFAGPQQHLILARFRAIERGLPLVRAANTGISTVIDSRGAMGAHLPLNTLGALDAPLPPRSAPPPYARMGDLPLAILLSLALALGVLRTVYLTARPVERD
ncbi:apolipoprotein N-acyltransferase [Dinoroseobacter sp. S375]|uniref:apolipoprotein N-acyltransferase n=1 Tax=Dinoroseobacter sp. S375 TaxID=3415136 RepID=UPI003C7ADB22